MPTNNELYTSLVIKASIIATNGGINAQKVAYITGAYSIFFLLCEKIYICAKRTVFMYKKRFYKTLFSQNVHKFCDILSNIAFKNR